MQKELALVKEFHKKFRAPVLDQPSVISTDRSDFRYNLMNEEIQEYYEGVRNEDIPNIAKELADVLYSVYGTILEHGLQDHMEAVFAEVHRSNMSKEYGPQKMIKGNCYTPADVEKILQ